MTSLHPLTRPYRPYLALTYSTDPILTLAASNRQPPPLAHTVCTHPRATRALYCGTDERLGLPVLAFANPADDVNDFTATAAAVARLPHGELEVTQPQPRSST